ncbi:hypothetical protein [Halorarius litoreus]|uniref:hypothetical protein n=1 Tax=Halorarius litoreus TaxID=2962676 RepID=UPI0020CF5C11|nr:hypothetical protein [Halorarius litoreus]
MTEDEDTTDQEKRTTDDGDDRPALDEDERASFDPDAVGDVAEEIEAEVNDSEAEAREGGGDAEESDENGSEHTPVELEDVSLSWGDLYVESVATLLVVVADVYGEDADISTDVVVDLAQSGLVDISTQVDRLVAEMGGAGASELPPEYAVLLGTALLAVAVLVKETDVAEDLLADVAGGTPLAGGVA